MKLKLRIFFMLFAIFASLLLSAPISSNAALDVARNYTRNLGRTPESPIAIDDECGTLVFVFPLSRQGYIAVSADTDIEPVISYSLENNFDFVPSDSNILLEMIMLDMQSRRNAINRTSESVIHANNAKWESLINGNSVLLRALESSEIYGPHLITSWNQSAPFNTYCPIDPHTGSRSITGCTATAMAQILNYWRYPAFVRFTSADNYRSGYEAPYINIEAPTASIDTIEYTTYLGPHPSDHFKAALSYAAGVSVKSNYGSTGTGANVDGDDYNYYWGYKNSIRVSGDAGDFYDLLQADMIEGRPAQLAIYKDGWRDGHSIVCDGFNTSGLYHLNMGWGGSYNNWYSLPAGMPTGYSIISYGVVNIEPDPRVDFTNICSDAVAISPTPTVQSIRNVIYPIGDEDWFVFHAVRESTYIFYSSGNSGAIAEIYSSCGTEPILSSGMGVDGVNFELEFLPLENEDYYLRIAGAGDSTYGYYDLSYQTFPGPEIHIIAPSSDAEINEESNYIIRWEKRGIPSFTNVRVEYSLSGPEGPWTTIHETIAWTFCMWTVPDVDGHVHSGYIRITSIDYNFVTAMNSAPFTIIDVSSIAEIDLPQEFCISAHPNPFNSAVSITVNNTTSQSLKVEIFDLSGRHVASLNPYGDFSKEKSWEFIWTPPEHVSSGIYLLRAIVGDNIASKRIVYLK